jgi:hypothetical protein
MNDNESDLPADLQAAPDGDEPSGLPAFEMPPESEYAPVITAQLQDLGVTSEHAGAAMDWLRDNATQQHELTARSDNYSIDVRGFSTDELPGLHNFLGRMHDEGIPQANVESMLRWYQEARSKAPAPNTSAMSSRDTDDKHRAVAELQRRWGHSYDERIGDAQRYLNSLPRMHREALVAQVLPNGVRALNDPSTLTWLANQANASSAPRYPNTIRMSSSDRARIDEIEAVMRTDRRRYNRDEQMQSEYRRLLAQREANR